jgi:UDP-N-acetylmuramate--alanine ligase
MSVKELPESLQGVPIYLVGIKGQGMTALAEILSARGASVSGSDTHERFYTDAILKRLGIPYYESFSADHISSDFFCVIHSVAYDPNSNPELKAAETMGLPVSTYPEALGMLSRNGDFSGISGVHGKSTTTAMTGILLKALDLPATVLSGTEVPAFGNRASLIMGDQFFVAETDEFRRNFLNYSPDRVVITSIEPDHLDYFRNLEDILGAFTEYANSLPEGGVLVFNTDDQNVRLLAQRLFEKRDDLTVIPYGTQAEGLYRIDSIDTLKGKTCFRLRGFDAEFVLKVPGRHNAYNATAAIALASCIREKAENQKCDPRVLREALESFGGSRRRCEVLGYAGGILFMDDYAHHPTAVRETLKGIREFYPEKRIVVDFMSHTYSRTKALLTEFGDSFASADRVILHKIYSSAREVNRGEISGRDLFNEVSRHHGDVVYFEEPFEAAPYLKSSLGKDDLFLTMGAGDNWRLGAELFDELSREVGDSN